MKERNLSYYFPDSNNVAGLKVFKEAGSSLTGFYFTKENLSKVLQQNHSRNYAIYFLFNDSEEQTVYIGQSTNGAERIKEHIKKKKFWTYCILIISDNNSFDHSAINYLEYFFIEAFKNTYFSMDNYQSKPAPIIDPFLNVTYVNYASQIKFLLEANGIFFVDRKTQKSKELIFKAGKGKEAELFIHNGIYFLAEGSIIRKPSETTKDWSDGGKFFQRFSKMFEDFITTGKAIMINEENARMVESVPFKSPSAPASLCSGFAENGYVFWQGLDEYRRND